MEMEQPSILDASEPVSRAVNEISRTGLPVLITKNGKYFGLIDERSIRQRTANPSKEKCETIAERTPVLSPESTVMDACNAFFAGRFKAIPIIEGGKVAGAITRHTLLSELLQEKMLSRKRVAEVMTSPVATVDLSSSVGQARSELRRHNIRRLVVTSGGKVAGLISIFDLAHFVASPKQSSAFYRAGEKTSQDSQPVSSYMKKQVETVSGSEPLSVAVKKMLERGVAALVVSDSGYPEGILTAKDVLHAALADEKGAERVFVSGLPYEQREAHPDIVEEGERALSKLGREFAACSLALHIKPEGPGFSVRARLNGARHLNASASGFKLESAVKAVLSEMKRMAHKESRMGGAQKRKREISRSSEES